MVVFPAASSPTMRMRISFLEKSRAKIRLTVSPMVSADRRPIPHVGRVSGEGERCVRVLRW
eukprot:scaffold1204_cov313-Pavlova_lutheri.AAC.1